MARAESCEDGNRGRGLALRCVGSGVGGLSVGRGRASCHAAMRWRMHAKRGLPAPRGNVGATSSRLSSPIVASLQNWQIFVAQAIRSSAAQAFIERRARGIGRPWLRKRYVQVARGISLRRSSGLLQSIIVILPVAPPSATVGKRLQPGMRFKPWARFDFPS